MALYNITQGGLVNALDPQQIINLLTGVMTDQQVTIGNRIQAALTGSTAASGYVGGTATGSPASGAHLVGDFSVDQTGTIWICTVAGTPGTFVHLGQVETSNSWQAAQTFPAANGIIMGTGAAALTFTSAQASAQTLTFPAIRQAETVAIKPQEVFASPANQTGTTSTTAVMLGAGTTSAITPSVTGRLLVMACGSCFNATAIGDGGSIGLRVGTGTAPANGAALVGTAVNSNFPKYVAATTAEKAPFGIMGFITGLTLGTGYWIDMTFAAITGGTFTIQDLSIMAVEF